MNYSILSEKENQALIDRGWEAQGVCAYCYRHNRSCCLDGRSVILYSLGTEAELLTEDEALGYETWKEKQSGHVSAPNGQNSDCKAYAHASSH